MPDARPFGRRRPRGGYVPILLHLAGLTGHTPEPGWMDSAACATTDPSLFFATTPDGTRAALRICGGCPVQASCLHHALTSGEQHGIWGGTTHHQRRALRIHARKQARRQREHKEGTA